MKKKPEAPLVPGKPVASENSKAPEPGKEEAKAWFPIVGVGASAGGLEALTQFLEKVPDQSGLAFVIVQHLDPDHAGLLPDLLQRVTKMPVEQVKDRTRIRTDCVYVIPPNKDMSILHGVLHLFDPAEPRGLRLPIDLFFRSLADDRRERSIGVILSGMGSDGTLGLRAIKEKGGLSLVQDPASAKFTGMPGSAIKFGLADLVASAEDLPGKLLDYLQRTPQTPAVKVPPDDKELSALEKVIILLRGKTGNDFSQYKKSTLYRRIERRMGIHQIDTIDAYVGYLRNNSQELELLFNELLIGVTSFFRDPAAWDFIRDEVIPQLFAQRPAGGVLRAWSAGCSTGEEAYSLAMVFKEALTRVNPQAHFTLQIFATDLDREAINKARQGIFLPNIAIDVAPQRLADFFVREEHGYRIKKDIREMVVFATQNVISDPPFTKLDLLICRNLLIYFDADMQKKLLPVFHYALNPGGVLFLGSAETLGASAELFSPINAKTRIFQRGERTYRPDMLFFPNASPQVAAGAHKEPTTVKAESNLQSFAERILLQKFSPPAVLVNDKGDIVYTSARTGKFLEPAVGKANLNIFAMAREGLRHALFEAFNKALNQPDPVVVRNVKVGTNGGAQATDLTVQKLMEPELQGMIMIVFCNVAAVPALSPKRRAATPVIAAGSGLAELEAELQKAREDQRIGREELQNSQEEMQTSQEELKASNEELQSMNEELQSTNEELTTSKEEMQSMNEELQTVNAEQQARVDELSHLNDDMRNFLDCTEVATIFLDRGLNIRRFASGCSKIFKLISTDVGRPLTDIANDLCAPEFTEDAKTVLRTLIPSERQVRATDGRWFAVRILPYRTNEEVIDGVVITVTETTAARELEEKLRAEIAFLKKERAVILSGGAPAVAPAE